MKILIVRSFPDILNLNAYNVQEIGLAKALTCKGLECGIVLYNGGQKDRTERYAFFRDGKEYSFTIYWLRGFSFFKNGIMPSVFRLISQYDVIQVHEYDQILSWMLYTRMKKPTVIYHGPYYHEYAKGYNLKCKVFDTLFLRNRRPERAVCLTKSEPAADFLRKKGFSHVRAVGVGVDQEQFQADEQEQVRCLLEPDESVFRLLYVGKIEARRNVYFLAELFERLLAKKDHLELVIVGSGEPDYVKPFLERIKKWTEEGRIRYIPKATQKELASVYRNANLFVFPSNYEIFGMVLLEALYFGLPVVSSQNGGASVLIRNGKNGYMLEGFALSAWEEKILQIAGNRELYEKMKKDAHDTVEKHFLWDKLADRFLAGYEEARRMYRGEAAGR